MFWSVTQIFKQLVFLGVGAQVVLESSSSGKKVALPFEGTVKELASHGDLLTYKY